MVMAGVLRKRPAVPREEEEEKNAKPRPDDKEVEEFFSLIRRIRTTAKLIGKEKERSPTFHWEDFLASFHDRPGITDVERGDGSGSSTPDERLTSTKEEEEEEKKNGMGDKGLREWLDLNVDPGGQ